MDGLVVGELRIVVAQAQFTQAKTAMHGGGDTSRFPGLSASLKLLVVHETY